MARVITFSTKFPSYHPKKGEPTEFVSKIIQGLRNTVRDYWVNGLDSILLMEYGDILLSGREVVPKYHTIRAGNRWKVGDKFSPRIWSGKPYNSKQIVIAPDIEVVKTWDVVINRTGLAINKKYVTSETIDKIIKNDGLNELDFNNWFIPLIKKQPFDGQIICWSDQINY